MKDMTKERFWRCSLVFLLTLFIILSAGIFSEWMDGRKTAQTMQTVSERVLIPGGQSVGIRMDVKGVLVVGLEEIETKDGVRSPGYDAGLQIGDIILSINGTPVHYAEDVQQIVNEKDRSLLLEVLRKNETLVLSLQTAEAMDGSGFKIGVWVKERIAGIGTLSFYDPQTGVFAALGHGIYESKTGTLLEAGSGQLLRTEVKSIREGTSGEPGEIRGIFYGDEKPAGQVKKNSQFGIYSLGTGYWQMEDAEPMVMASQEQIEEGPAVILTTIDGSRVEAFDIVIERVNRQKEAGSKGLEITVTDERLLAYCGGIVQGMSGSPILQNNRIVGAVTHVLVDNPTKGYGIFAEWMVKECDSVSQIM